MGIARAPIVQQEQNCEGSLARAPGAIITQAQDTTEFLKECKSSKRKAFVGSFIRETVGMPSKAVVHYEVPTAKASQSHDGDAEELVLAGPLESASNGVQ